MGKCAHVAGAVVVSVSEWGKSQCDMLGHGHSWSEPARPCAIEHAVACKEGGANTEKV